MIDSNRAVCRLTSTAFFARVPISPQQEGAKNAGNRSRNFHRQRKPRFYLAGPGSDPGLGPTRGRRLVDQFGGAQNIFKASLTELEATGIKASSAQSLATGQSMELAHDEMGLVAAAGVCVVCLEDPLYPAQLKQIYDPPLALYLRRNVAAIVQPGIAIVGTRHPTPYGLGMAERLACDPAARGLVIFSGLARGVDSAGHRGNKCLPWAAR